MLHLDFSSKVLSDALADHYIDEETVTTLDLVGDDWTDDESEDDAESLDLDCQDWIPYEAVTTLGIDLSAQFGKDRHKVPKFGRFARSYADITEEVQALRAVSVARRLSTPPRDRTRARARGVRRATVRGHVRCFIAGARAEDRVLIQDIIEAAVVPFQKEVVAGGMRMLLAPRCPLEEARERLPTLLAGFERAVLDVQEDGVRTWAGCLALLAPVGKPQALRPVEPQAGTRSDSESSAPSEPTHSCEPLASEGVSAACAFCEELLMKFSVEAAIYEEMRQRAAEEELRIAEVDQFLLETHATQGKIDAEVEQLIGEELANVSRGSARRPSHAELHAKAGADVVQRSSTSARPVASSMSAARCTRDMPGGSAMPVGSPATAARKLRLRQGPPVVFRLEDEPSGPTRESSLARGYEALGVEMHLLDGADAAAHFPARSSRSAGLSSAMELDLGGASHSAGRPSALESELGGGSFGASAAPSRLERSSSAGFLKAVPNKSKQSLASLKPLASSKQFKYGVESDAAAWKIGRNQMAPSMLRDTCGGAPMRRHNSVGGVF